MITQQKSFIDESNALYIVSTPIGNLSDITYRAIATLKKVDLILVEDTRVSIKLLNHYGITSKMLSYHDYNKDQKEQEILTLLEKGYNLALISDAGTPSISDPGYELIRETKKRGYKVIVVPGVSAFLGAVVASGFLSTPFVFLGFLPRKRGEFEALLTDYKYRKETLVIYESPVRIRNSLDLIYEVIGNRKIALVRELTKKFEEIVSGDLEQIKELELVLKGEYVLVIEGLKDNEDLKELPVKKHVEHYLKAGYLEKEALKLVAKDKGVSKSEIYKQYKIK